MLVSVNYIKKINNILLMNIISWFANISHLCPADAVIRCSYNKQNYSSLMCSTRTGKLLNVRKLMQMTIIFITAAYRFRPCHPDISQHDIFLTVQSVLTPLCYHFFAHGCLTSLLTAFNS